ncbi:DUF11 domain-containing protein [Clostridium taeniosporum]|uniref:Appendage protein P29a n=2 Tax=Clostridium taeniosporum TaxID=394958 RepID=Q0PIT1_9CLOT|nr:DUF11 domain-containing protein [Clostridium taeniosporum]ABH03028.1 appendage protein P29a [Clostridium taeniosporum]AOR24018.1 hypothetical protein BGI42_09875 [Clostridium taeniosporum]
MVELKVLKSADRSYVFFGISNRIKYSISITNIGDTKATSVKVKDLMSKGAQFIPGTFTINGCCQDINGINRNINVGSIKPGSNTIITFDVEIVEYNPPSEIVNKAIVTYCDENGNVLVAESQELVIPIIKINVGMKKTVDKCTAKVGEIVSYSVLITNNSNIKIDNVVFYDSLPKEVQLLPASVLINLEPQYNENFDGGIPLGTLNAYSSIMISFQVVIVSLPNSKLLKNSSTIEFSYTILDNGIPVTSLGEACSCEVITKVLDSILQC